MKLNLGCGRDIKKGYVNLDIINNKGVDVIHNLNKFPYPFKENTFEEVICKQVLPILDDIIKVMEEIHRISKPNAVIKIEVPFFSSVGHYTDITYKHAFTTKSFQYFRKDNPLNYYTKARFKVKSKIILYGLYKILEPFVNLSNKIKHWYEIYFSFIFPASTINFELKVLK